MRLVVGTEMVVEDVVERITDESAESSFPALKLAVPGRSERPAVDRKHGEQLRVESLIELAPDTLAASGKVPGLAHGASPALAMRIVRRYAAVTRSKRLVVLVADPRALELALVERRREERRTRLAERLPGELGRAGALA